MLWKDSSDCSVQCQLEGTERRLKATSGVWIFSHGRCNEEQKTDSEEKANRFDHWLELESWVRGDYRRDNAGI